MTKQTKDAGGPKQSAPAPMPTPAIILVEPQLGENIGAAARAMANFGLSDLRLVAPRDGWPSESAAAAAAGADAVIGGARLYESVDAAVADLRFVCATTARSRDMIKSVLAPDAALAEIAARSRTGDACGIMFGPEKSGLDNDHLALCDAIVTAPVDPAFASLNLAQAVLLVSYEWIRQQPDQSLGRKTEFDGPVRPGLQMLHTRPATREEIIGFFEHLERELDHAGFLRPPEKRPGMVRNIRNLFNRIGATEQEIRTLRGIVASLAKSSTSRGEVP